ncbi:hypothetical protein MAFF241647_32840 [Ralstonia solanacearum]|nr:hypothetical protein MAFF241647_32840 [Ralstonia solanacearum]
MVGIAGRYRSVEMEAKAISRLRTASIQRLRSCGGEAVGCMASRERGMARTVCAALSTE